MGPRLLPTRLDAADKCMTGLTTAVMRICLTIKTLHVMCLLESCGLRLYLLC